MNKLSLFLPSLSQKHKSSFCLEKSEKDLLATKQVFSKLSSIGGSDVMIGAIAGCTGIGSRHVQWSRDFKTDVCCGGSRVYTGENTEVQDGCVIRW